jgi:uncharacterized protein (DUF1684 family)
MLGRMTDALGRFRAEKDLYFRENPGSPVEDAAFSGLSYYPASEAHVVTAALEPLKGRVVVLETSTGDEQPYFRSGRATFETDDERVFVPFRDATSGTQTYGAGRYLEASPLSEGRVLLDFNYACSLFCAFSARYRCPLTNRLSMPVRAGEMRYGGLDVCKGLSRQENP